MKAHIPLPSKMRQEALRVAQESANKEKADIATRAQYLWAIAMLQCGLSPKTIAKVADTMEKVVIPKYAEYRTDGLADLFAQDILQRSGVNMPATKEQI